MPSEAPDRRAGPPPVPPDFRRLFEALPGLFLVLAPDFRIVAASDAYLQATMTVREEILGRGIFDVFPDNPEDPGATGVANLRASLQRVVRDRVADSMAVQKYDVRRPESQGGGFEQRWWSPANSPVLGPDGQVAYIVHRADDVTEFIRFKEQEAAREETTRRLLTRGEEMEAEIVARGSELQATNRRLRKANEELSRLQAQLERRVKIRTLELAQANAALRDENAERAQTQESLRASEERTRLLIEGVKDYAISMLDPKGNVVTWNAGAERIMGWTAEEIVGSSHARLFPPEDVAAGAPVEGLRRAAAEGRFDADGWRVRKNGERFWVNGVLTALYDADGEVRGFAKIVRDLTWQHRQEQLLRSVLDHIEDSVVCIDPRGTIATFNEAAERAFGYSQAEAVGANAGMLLAEGLRREYAGYLSKAARGDEAKLVESARTIECRRKDGTYFPARLTVGEFQAVEGGGRHFTAVLHDLTEQRKLEAQLRQSQKMDAFGQLAGGVAHDFNNLLTVIGGFSEMLLMQYPAGHPDREFLMEIHDAGERAASLTRQLLAFSRQQVLEPKVLNLNSVVRDIEKMLVRLIGEDVRLTAVLLPKLAPVKVDPGQIEQVVVNLAVNARDAMPQGGQLTIETQNVELDENYCRTHPEVKPGRYVLLAAADTGTGMNAETKSRIFEPFFTTKGVGRGTGLGLSVVQGIVKQSGGSIEVYSEPGVGTTFKIYLPAVLERPSGDSTRRPAPHARGVETILLVEDEAAVRELSATALARFGYKVLKASSAKEALRLFDAFPEPIALVATDVVMPEMGGGLLAEALREKRPGIKVLFLSGYTDDAVIRHGVLQANVAFLQKPFTPAGLARKVRETLDKP